MSDETPKREVKKQKTVSRIFHINFNEIWDGMDQISTHSVIY